MVYSPTSVAKEFARISENGATHMKLQKLVYMAYGTWLRDHEEPFVSEPPQVWQYGPVFASLYHLLKIYKSTPIGVAQFEEIAPAGEIAENDKKALISKVWKKYGTLSAISLSNITHVPGSPWHEIASSNKFRVPTGTAIPDDLMKRYFRASPDMAI